MRNVVVTAFLLATTLSVSADEVSDIDRFELWNQCLSMGLVVENSSQDAANISLTKEDIETAVRSRLRAARLYDADPFTAYLYVNVHMVGPAVGIAFRLYRLVSIVGSGEVGRAITWQAGSTRTHGDDAGFMVNRLSRHADRFIDEYLRVNADACQQ